MSTSAQSVKSFRVIREPFSAWSHLFGAALAIAGLVWLVSESSGNAKAVTAFSLFGASMIFLYVASGIYHALPLSEIGIQRLQRLDHSAIFILIAGSYIPVCLLSLPAGWGWSIFGVEIGLATAGILSFALWRNQPDWLRMVFYIVMGWLALIAIAPLKASLPSNALNWLLTGGVLYTVGAVIFAMDRPHLLPGRFSAHDLWHLFVLAGTGSHFIVMLKLAESL